MATWASPLGMPVNSEQEIEAELGRRGLDRPRITPEAIDQKIIGEAFYVFPGTTMTVCCLTLENGYHVIGQSAAASPENFNEEIGRKIAWTDARDKIWQLEGYLLKERLHQEEQQNQDVATPQQPVDF